MQCIEFDELLSASLDQALSREEEILLKNHLQACAACVLTLQHLQQTKALVRSLQRVEVPATLKPGIQLKLKQQNKVAPPVLARLWGATALLAASLVAVFGFITFVGYVAPQPNSRHESNVYLSNHAYHLMTQPLADRSSWSYIAGESNFELLAEE